MRSATLRELWRRYASRFATRAHVRETSDEESARKYWDRQIEEDHERRGVDDKHA